MLAAIKDPDFAIVNRLACSSTTLWSPVLDREGMKRPAVGDRHQRIDKLPSSDLCDQAAGYDERGPIKTDLVLDFDHLARRLP